MMDGSMAQSGRVVWARLLAMTVPRGAAAALRQGAGAGDDGYFSATFERFFQQHEARITGYLWRMVNDEATACDLCQETFIRAWQHFAEVQAAQQPAAWLFRVATNLALNHLRAETRGVRAALPLSAVDDPAGSDPSVRFVEHDFVQSILAELPPKQRALLILRDVYHFSFEEVGALLGIAPSGVRMALCRARTQFRDRYLHPEAHACGYGYTTLFNVLTQQQTDVTLLTQDQLTAGRNCAIDGATIITAHPDPTNTVTGFYEIDHADRPGTQARLLFSLPLGNPNGFSAKVIGADTRLLLLTDAQNTRYIWDRQQARLISPATLTANGITGEPILFDNGVIGYWQDHNGTPELVLRDEAALPTP